jgi:hypothetical protein
MSGPSLRDIVIEWQQWSVQRHAHRKVGLYEVAAFGVGTSDDGAHPGDLGVDQAAEVVKHPEFACAAFKFGTIIQESEHMAGQVLRSGDAL